MSWAIFFQILQVSPISFIGVVAEVQKLKFSMISTMKWTPPYTHYHLSNKRGVHAYQFWKIPHSTKWNPPSTFIDFITKVSNIIAEPNEDFSHSHFELWIFIPALQLMEKVQLILQLLHPYTFIPTSTVIY